MKERVDVRADKAQQVVDLEESLTVLHGLDTDRETRDC